MSSEELTRAYERARRRAALRGMPVSQQEVSAELGPVFSDMARRNLADQSIDLKRQALALQADQGIDLKRQTLAQQASQFAEKLAAERQMFNERTALGSYKLGLEEDRRSSMEPIQWANVGISGVGNLGLGYYSMLKDEEYKKRLMDLMNRRYA